MIKIEYPPYQPQIKVTGGKEHIFDGIRRRWVVLTPEEWVRQNFIRYLVDVKKYPASLIAVEKEIRLGELTKRFDIVVYDQHTAPWMIVECKEMEVQLNRAVLEQVLRYNIALQAPFVGITNGIYCAAFALQAGEWIELEVLPDMQKRK